MPHAQEETFATELRRLRGDLSLRELARRACCSKSIISDLEHERRSPTPRIASALDRALGADGTLEALAHANRQRGNGEAAPHGAEDDLFQGWDDVWRRDFLKGTGAIGAVTVAGLGGDGTDSGGKELLSAHIALRAAHGRLDNLRGAAAVYTQAVDHHQQILTWLGTVRTTAEASVSLPSRRIPAVSSAS